MILPIVIKRTNPARGQRAVRRRLLLPGRTRAQALRTSHKLKWCVRNSVRNGVCVVMLPMKLRRKTNTVEAYRGVRGCTAAHSLRRTLLRCKGHCLQSHASASPSASTRASDTDIWWGSLLRLPAPGLRWSPPRRFVVVCRSAGAPPACECDVRVGAPPAVSYTGALALLAAS